MILSDFSVQIARTYEFYGSLLLLALGKKVYTLVSCSYYGHTGD